MQRRKLLITLIAMAAALVTLLTQPSLAYYAYLGEATSVITSGDIKCRIVEKMGNGEFPKDGVYIVPGSTVSKKVSVKNIGNHPFWLRIKLKNAMDGSELSADLLKLDINDKDWTFDEGYYYYNKPVLAGAETEQLFSQVKVSGDADSTYLGKVVKLSVCAYAVQSENNNASSPLDVVGWPAES